MSDQELAQLIYLVGGGALVVFTVIYPFFVLFKDLKMQALYGRCPDAAPGTVRHHIVWSQPDKMLRCDLCGAGFVSPTG